MPDCSRKYLWRLVTFLVLNDIVEIVVVEISSWNTYMYSKALKIPLGINKAKQNM